MYSWGPARVPHDLQLIDSGQAPNRGAPTSSPRNPPEPTRLRLPSGKAPNLASEEAFQGPKRPHGHKDPTSIWHIWYMVYSTWYINIRILPTMVSGIPLMLVLGTRT